MKYQYFLTLGLMGQNLLRKFSIFSLPQKEPLKISLKGLVSEMKKIRRKTSNDIFGTRSNGKRQVKARLENRET